MQSDGVDQELSQFLLSLPRAAREWGANQALERLPRASRRLSTALARATVAPRGAVAQIEVVRQK